ncbi:MAG TPA: hypothetical protein VF746_16495 [Longimicrobium sp.]|jgi:hypothetical protein
MTKLMRGARGAVLAAATLAAAGCSQLGTLGNVLGGVMGQQGGGNGEVYGEVRALDTQRQIIQIETSNGQVGNVYFDNRTRVVYQQQEYPVTALERGDQVAMRIRQDQQGTAYTDYISVTQSVQERGGYGGSTSGSGSTYGMQSLEGRVNWVDYNRGEFSVNTSRGQAIVFLRYNASSYEANRFRQLRQGSYVRLQGRYVSQDRFELDRFY